MASFQSADDMLDEVNFCVSCLAPLGGPRIAAALRKVHSVRICFGSSICSCFTAATGYGCTCTFEKCWAGTEHCTPCT